MRITPLACLLATGLSGCVVAPDAPAPVAVVQAPAVQAQVYTPPPIPAERVEVVPVAPGPRFIWQPGEYRFERGVYVWVPGHYVQRLAAYHHWVRPHWAPGGVWVPGHWV